MVIRFRTTTQFFNHGFEPCFQFRAGGGRDGFGHIHGDLGALFHHEHDRVGNFFHDFDHRAHEGRHTVPFVSVFRNGARQVSHKPCGRENRGTMIHVYMYRQIRNVFSGVDEWTGTTITYNGGGSNSSYPIV